MRVEAFASSWLRMMYDGAADFDSNLEIRWDLEPLPCLPPIGIREEESFLTGYFFDGSSKIILLCSPIEDLKAYNRGSKGILEAMCPRQMGCSI